MSETLVIRLVATDRAAGPDAGLAEWAVVDATGACVVPPAAGPLGGAESMAAGRRTVVLVPAERVLRTRAEVPVKGASRIAQALPFALEDLLAEDVEELHFAAGARLADGQVAVAVVRQEWMASWLARLDAAGINPQALYADSDGVIDVEGTSTLILEQQHAILRDPGGDPVVAELDGLDSLLALWLAQPRPPAVDGAVPPRNLQVYDATVDGVSNATWENLQAQVESLEVRRLADGALLRLAAVVVTSPGVNLLQGDYARRTSMGSYWPRWRLAAALVGALAVTMIAATGADAWRLKRESAGLETTIRQAASFTFPGMPDSGDLRALVDARLQGSNGTPSAAGKQRFLATLQIVAGAVAKTGNATVEGMNYRAGVMELQVRAPSADSLDSIRKLVTENGDLKAEIQSSNSVGDEIQGRIRISVGGA
jgi:general secretion pathway protein L